MEYHRRIFVDFQYNALKFLTIGPDLAQITFSAKVLKKF